MALIFLPIGRAHERTQGLVKGVQVAGVPLVIVVRQLVIRQLKDGDLKVVLEILVGNGDHLGLVAVLQVVKDYAPGRFRRLNELNDYGL